MAASSVRVDKRGLEQLLRDGERRTDALIDALALEGERVVKTSMGTSPAGRRYKRGSVIHVVSRPGDPPNVDTGKLLNSLYVRKPRGNQRVIGTDVEYATHLEFGTVKMAARPFMRPMLMALKDAVDDLAKATFD